MLKRRLALAVAVPLTLGLAACGGGSPETEPASASDASAAHEYDSFSHDELVAAAEEEGEVTVYSFTSRIAAVEEAFEAEYPGIDLIGHDISSTEQITRLSSEAEAGAPSADVAYISDAPVVLSELVETGILTGYVPERVADTVPQEYQEPLLANRLSTKILMYNEEAHPDGSPIENLWELTEEEWNGKVVMVDPNVRGDYLDLMTEIVLQSDAMAEAYESHTGEAIELDGTQNAGEEFLKRLYANGLVLVDDTDNVNAAVGATDQDDPPVGITSYSDRRDNEEEGWALQASLDTEPALGITFPASIGMVQDSANPAGARLVADFLMGDDSATGGAGYEPFYVPGDYPVRTDVDAPEDAAPLEELGAWDIDPAATAESRGEVSDFLLSLS
ncbi:iron(III) transport system substrate-binding protein [Brevibacterium sp. Mu109]|uniref:ABC transporter substrate-binding protein n=1 Tax=Brevibacterium sp. Mu109 TaxID=1255669 RepID=UPI000C46D0B3|nr:ABC transporter substrate-binding protein [Brevibacterium sp. Mu109]SMX85636.1 iron(III) transport system substrate-binding protein [Brevibacterium sp. Mu109]